MGVCQEPISSLIVVDFSRFYYIMSKESNLSIWRKFVETNDRLKVVEDKILEVIGSIDWQKETANHNLKYCDCWKCQLRNLLCERAGLEESLNSD